MNASKPGVRGGLGWLWRHVSAGVAVVLIALALLCGYLLGRPSQPVGSEKPRPEASVAEAGSEQRRTSAMYTCSMHPSVRLADPDAVCPICSMDLIPVDEGGAETTLTLSESEAEAAGVETREIGRFYPTAEVRLYGKVVYDETSVARLTAYFPGRIERLFVNYVGVPVGKGEHVAEVYSPELLAAFEELRQAARAAGEAGDGSGIVRRSTRDTLVAAREKLRLFGLTDAQISEVESGEFDGDRFTVYAPMGGVVTRLGIKEGDYVETGDPIATVADLSRLWLDLEAYESQLPVLRWGQRVTFTMESLPGERFEGRVGFIEPMVDAGSRTAAVRVAVDNADRRLKPGMFASAVVRPKIAEGGPVPSDELAGAWVGPMHPTVVKDGPGECDLCGMSLVPAESLGVVGDPESAAEPLVVPRSAVLFTGTRSVVYVSVPDAPEPTYEAREVVLGPRARGFYIVREGLGEGERVVVDGAFRIDSAMQIAAKPSMMSPGRGDRREGRGGSEPIAGLGGFVADLEPVYAAYFRAQEALADDDLGGFGVAADKLRRALGRVGEVALTGGALGDWRRAAAKLRVESEYASIDAARERFETMSEGIVSLERRFGHLGDQTWRLAHCPMAFDFKGADWLQRGEVIDNPYFGASMLRCGEIRGTFEPLGGDAVRGEGHDHD